MTGPPQTLISYWFLPPSAIPRFVTPPIVFICSYSLSSDHTSTKVGREWIHHHFKDISTPRYEKKERKHDAQDRQLFQSRVCARKDTCSIGDPSVFTPASTRRRRRARCNRCYCNLEGDSSIHHLLKSWWWKQRFGRQRGAQAGQTATSFRKFTSTSARVWYVRSRSRWRIFKGLPFDSNHVLLKLPVL